MQQIHCDDYCIITKTIEGKFVAEMNSLSLCGVQGFNFKLDDTVKERLERRVQAVVREALNPTDPTSRRLADTPSVQMRLIK